MGYTNSTPNLHLPQFIGSDKPTWLSDVNGAMLAIDTAYGTIEADASSASTAAAGAVTVAGAAQTAADAAATAAATAGTNASQALSTANNAATTANTALNAAEAATGKLIASVTTDGVKTIAQILNELGTAENIAAAGIKAILTVTGLGIEYTAICLSKSATEMVFGANTANNNGFSAERYTMNATNSSKIHTTITSGSVTIVDESSLPAADAMLFSLYA